MPVVGWCVGTDASPSTRMVLTRRVGLGFRCRTPLTPTAVEVFCHHYAYLSCLRSLLYHFVRKSLVTQWLTLTLSPDQSKRVVADTHLARSSRCEPQSHLWIGGGIDDLVWLDMEVCRHNCCLLCSRFVSSSALSPLRGNKKTTPVKPQTPSQLPSTGCTDERLRTEGCLEYINCAPLSIWRMVAAFSKAAFPVVRLSHQLRLDTSLGITMIESWSAKADSYMTSTSCAMTTNCA